VSLGSRKKQPRTNSKKKTIINNEKKWTAMNPI
jgi:hypothetical protein